MKIKIYFIVVLLIAVQQLQAQTFINKAVIEYEVKTNIKKTMGSGVWEEMMKDAMPTFKTGYFNYTFANNKSVYKFDHWDPKMKMPEWYTKSDEEEQYYVDFNTNKVNIQKNIFGSNFNLEDSIPVIQWRLSNENRVIAGYNCRKAVGRIMDSVYVFVFYTDEITISGGPSSINGLPGMILGMTIPRMYTSWIATKVTVDKVEEKVIAPITAKKYFTRASFRTMLDERTKEWFSEDDPDSKKWIEQFHWRTQL
ncbi:MAG: GLPGLI family protein [Ferruginibacter sp.]